jgi:trehalose synthase
VRKVRITDTSDLWWKSAVIYCIDVKTFMDWNDDGIGDFEGLAHRMDYLHELGVTCLWLMPFYPSPGRDDGYDVSDYYGVDPRLGSLGDVVEVVRTARDRGMRVIIDLVVNHTSVKHPWFVSARSSRNSPFRDFYVWRDKPPAHPQPVSFPGEETSTWQYDEKAGQYYLHSFYKEQPDLNVVNPKVRDEVVKLMGFWLELGISGFRVDAVPFFLDTAGVEPGDDELKNPFDFLRSLRESLGRRSGEGMLLGEVNLPRKEQVTYFGDDETDGLTMQFDFITMQNLYLSLARSDARPLAETLSRRPLLPVEAQWATFVRNHDELTLDKLTESERDEVFAAFGPEKNMQVYGRGIVRRLPPMLGGDPRRVKMVYSLLFSLPGTPVILYGEELGMGENLSIGGRMSVRTPMQWTTAKNGGFSNAAPSKLIAPLPGGAYSPDHVNASDQRHNPDSLLKFLQLLIARYRASDEIGWGELTILKQENHAVLAHSVADVDGRMIAVHNFASQSATVDLVLDGTLDGAKLTDLLTDGSTDVGPGGTVQLLLEGYGYRWLRVLNPGEKRLS